MRILGKTTYDKAASAFGRWRDGERAKAEEKRRVRAATELVGFDRTPARLRFVVWLATIGVIGFLILWVMQITGEVKLDWHLDMAWNRPWSFQYDFIGRFNVLPLVVLFVVSFAIVFWTKTWISLFASTPFSDWFTKWSCLLLGIGGSVAIVMGGFEVNQNTRQEDFRGALVAEQTATQGRAAIQAQMDSIDGRLAAMRDQSRVGVYAAIAASVGAAAYDSDYLSAEAMARTPAERRDIVRRARGAAVAADNLEAQRLQLVGQLAAATPAAATQAVVEMTDPVSRFIGGIGAWRIVILVVVGDLLLLLGNYYADRAEERNRYARSPQASGWAPEDHRIEDLRGEDAIVPQPMRPAREEVYDAETGERLIKVKGAKEHFRKAKPKKGERTQLNIQPDIPPDETGVAHDGGNRAGSVEAPSEPLSGEVADGREHRAEGEPSKDAVEQHSAEAHPEFSIPEDVEQAYREAEPELFADEPQVAQASEDEPQAEADAGDEQQHDEQNESASDHSELPEQTEREPETNPSRLIAAE